MSFTKKNSEWAFIWTPAPLSLRWSMSLKAQPSIVFRGQCADAFVVSDFAGAEVASAVSRLVRTNRLSADEAQARLTDFDTWRSAYTVGADVIPADVRLADLYVRRFDLKLRTPDALHAAICTRLDLVLVTLDQRLGFAAATLGIDVERPGASSAS